MPVTKLLSKQKLDVTMTAVMGQGKEHVKWSPGMAFFKNDAVLKVGKVDANMIIENCTDGVFVLKAGKLEVVQDKVYESNLLEHYASLDKGISIEYNDNIIFNLESWGQLSWKEILTESADILVQKTEELEKLI